MQAPAPDAASRVSRLYRVRKTVVEMLRDRGFLLQDRELLRSKDEFKEEFGEDPDREDLMILAPMVDDPTDQIFVFFPAADANGGNVVPVRRIAVVLLRNAHFRVRRQTEVQRLSTGAHTAHRPAVVVLVFVALLLLVPDAVEVRPAVLTLVDVEALFDHRRATEACKAVRERAGDAKRALVIRTRLQERALVRVVLAQKAVGIRRTNQLRILLIAHAQRGVSLLVVTEPFLVRLFVHRCQRTRVEESFIVALLHRVNRMVRAQTSAGNVQAFPLDALSYRVPLLEHSLGGERFLAISRRSSPQRAFRSAENNGP